MKSLANKISIFENEAAALTAIDAQMQKEQVTVVSFINAHAYTMANSSEAFKTCLLDATVLLRDGIGAKLLLKRYNKAAGYNANGTDLIPQILDFYKSQKICFIGTESPYIDIASSQRVSQGNNICAFIDGFKDTNTMYNFVTEHKPDILILGMGMPKQEAFASHLQSHYQGKLLVVNGGAIFDFIAGRFNRAPAFFRKLNIEWLYRLLNEPVRLFKRYVIGIPKFFIALNKNVKNEESK